MVEGVHRLSIPIEIKHRYLKIRPPDSLSKLKHKLKGLWKEDVMKLVAIRSDGEKFIIEDEEDYRISLAHDNPKLPGLELRLVFKDTDRLSKASKLTSLQSPLGSVVKYLDFKTPIDDSKASDLSGFNKDSLLYSADRSTVAGLTPYQTPSIRNQQRDYTDTPLQVKFCRELEDTGYITHFTCNFGKDAILSYEISTGNYKKFINSRFLVSARTTAGIDGRVYITGGIHYPNQLLEMNLITGDITQGPPIPTPRFWHASVVLNNQIWVIGGASLYKRHPINSVEVYPIDQLSEETISFQNTWRIAAPLNFARSNLTACVHKERLIIGGGNISATEFNPTDTFEQWVDGRWIVLNVRLPTGLTSFALAFVNAKEVLVVGGKNKSYSITNELYVLDIDNGCTTKVDTIHSPERFLNSQSLDSGDFVSLYSFCGNLYNFEKRSRQLSIISSPVE